MKDNKIDIMVYKIGGMVGLLHKEHDNTQNPAGMQGMMEELEKALRVLQIDLFELRKCTLDNPDYKFSDHQSKE